MPWFRHTPPPREPRLITVPSSVFVTGAEAGREVSVTGGIAFGHRQHGSPIDFYDLTGNAAVALDGPVTVTGVGGTSEIITRAILVALGKG